MEGWGGRAPRRTGCGAVQSPSSQQWALGVSPAVEPGLFVTPSLCFWSRREPVTHPSTVRALARPLPARVKSKSSLGMSAAAFPLRLCFLPPRLASLAWAEL